MPRPFPLACLAALVAANAAAQARTPVAAYWVTHHDVRPPTGKPWTEAFELPRLVIYDDGLVVKATAEGQVTSVTLSAAERAAVANAGGDAFFTLPDSVSGTRELHPPVHLVTRWGRAGRKTVRFFGALNTAEHRAKAPPALLAALDTLAGFAHAGFAPFRGEALEVRACRTQAAPDKASWPKVWPAPAAGQKVSALDGCFVHHVPEAQRAAAEALARDGASFGVVRHGREPWLVTLVRVVLPAEDAWAGR